MEWIIGLFGLSLPVIIVVFFFLLSWVRVLNEYERGVVYRLGRITTDPVGPGLFILIAPPIIDRMVKVDLRTVTMDVKPQDVITKDNVSLKVSAVIYYRVVDPARAINEVEQYDYATSQLAQTTLRSVAGQVDMDTLLVEREQLSNQIQTILDEQTHPWGIKVISVEIKQIDLPEEMQRAMARQAESERIRRAKVISAEGEFQAAEKLLQAAKLMSENPLTIQMRYLQTLNDIGAEKNTTIVFPLPIELLEAFSVKRGN